MLYNVSIASWPILAIALILTFAATLLGRRAGLRGATWILISVGLGCLALAAAGIHWQRHPTGTVAVMVDLSPSTRGAAYRDPSWLKQRARQLLGRARHQLILFSDQNQTLKEWPAAPLGDLPCDHTTFSPPPDAVAILLFTDGRFKPPPASPPTYIVTDPALEQAASQDSAVTDLRIEGDQAVATVRGKGEIENQKWKRVSEGIDAAQIRFSVFNLPLPAPPAPITAQISHSDRWPENNTLSIIPPAPWRAQRWWVGSGAPPGWTAMTPDQLPPDPSAYLRPAIIVLNNVSAQSLPAIQQDRLEQYVRDLGGGLLIAGANRESMTGDSPDTALQRLSPLSSDPPEPTRQWIILLDASGSMNESAGHQSRWRRAASALRSTLTLIPAMDRLNVGGFSNQVLWWSRDRSARETRAMTLPPSEVTPHGPTNLEQSLDQVVGESRTAKSNKLPTELLILTDAEAPLPNSAALANGMRQARMRLWVLATGPGEALDSLKEIAAKTGGALLEESQLAQWSPALRKLARQARGTNLRHDPIRIRFEGPLTGTPSRPLIAWRKSWLKSGATPLAIAGGSGSIPDILAASWHVGSGQIAAAAFDPAPNETQAMAQQISARPTDPRFKVSWTTGRAIHVRVEAHDDKNYFNDLNLKLTFQPDAKTSLIPQTAPGQYAVTFPAPQHETLATIEHNDHPIDRIALARRYAPEFDAVGTDHAALIELAKRSGGKVISARQNDPIDFHWPQREMSLDPWLAILGACFIAGGLLRRKR